MAARPRVLLVTGTRPETLKMAPVVRALREDPELDVVFAVTGQHREMLQEALDAFELVPDHDLALMRPGQTPGGLVAAVMEGMERLLGVVAPDLVLVHGDTGSALGAALAAFYAGYRVGHVEAGLRSGRPREPFPEEANRVLVDRVCDLLLPPTRKNAAALAREGLGDRRTLVTGNTVIDALLEARERARGLPDPCPAAPEGAPLVLVTAHRRESFGEPFVQMCRGMREVVDRNPGVHLVYPVHLNPQVREVVDPELGGVARVHLIEPLGYLPFVRLMDRARVILTDSGGIQEEAPALGKPVLVMRDVTEREEGVEAGCLRLVGTDAARIAEETTRLLTDEEAYAAMSGAANPFGDGRAATRIRAGVRELLGLEAVVEEFGGV